MCMFVLLVFFWIVAVSQGALSTSGTPVTYESALWCFWNASGKWQPHIEDCWLSFWLSKWILKLIAATLWSQTAKVADAFQMKEPNSHFLPSKVDENTIIFSNWLTFVLIVFLALDILQKSLQWLHVSVTESHVVVSAVMTMFIMEY